jgi:tetratricopeptide (TPR) repeat protein
MKRNGTRKVRRILTDADYRMALLIVQLGIKAADQILRKVPNHGDTQAMKALILNSTKQKEAAFDLAKLALRSDMRSHVCWHVYGLLYRSDKNYEEAIKAYKMALKLAPGSEQIMRDLAFLQAQMRDYQGYIDTRHAILQANPQVRQNWTALAIAHHLAGNLAAAEDVLSRFEETLKNPPNKGNTAHSEAALYKNSLIAEMGDIQKALDHLKLIYKDNLDRTVVMELKAEYLAKLGKTEEAAKAYRALINRNPDYRAYFRGLESTLGEKKDDREALKSLYDELAEKYPRADAPRRVPLDFLEGKSSIMFTIGEC